jgi:hypothetical protein
MPHSKKVLAIEPYQPHLADEWNAVVSQSGNGTFLLDRRFMDYHQHRFCDCSLLIRLGQTAVACFPANHVAEEHMVVSHQGLTYGGLIAVPTLSSHKILEAYQLIQAYYRTQLQAQTLRIKPVPYIYHRYPSDAELYAFFRTGATLQHRGLSSAVIPQCHPPYKPNRSRSILRAQEQALVVRESRRPEEIEAFWETLNQRLSERHNTRPVHTAAEMQLLMERFPQQIRLFLCCRREAGSTSLQTADLLAGAWVFDTGQVAHTQYLSTSPEGREAGALDFLIHHLLHDTFAQHPYLDFGVSTEDGGHVLNDGLLQQKEAFGARGVCYDTWALPL